LIISESQSKAEGKDSGLNCKVYVMLLFLLLVVRLLCIFGASSSYVRYFSLSSSLFFSPLRNTFLLPAVSLRCCCNTRFVFFFPFYFAPF